MARSMPIRLKVNGREYERDVSVRKLLVDFLREDLGLLGTNIGCEHGVCGSCTVLMNGRTVRSCLTLAVQADGSEVITIEGLDRDGEMHPIKRAFWENYAFQCGYCAPGIVLTTYELLNKKRNPSQEEIREHLAGVLCRCTGYQFFVEAIKKMTESG